MRALVMTAIDRMSVREVEVDELRPDEVLVQTAASGLCHSDLTMLHGNMTGPFYVPKVLGHEVAGVIKEVGSAVTEFEVGDHVVGCNSRYCGTCPECLDGRSWLCSRRTDIPRDRPRLTLDGMAVAQNGQLGGFGEELIVGADTLAKVPKELPLDRAALLGCAVMTGVGAVFNGAKVTPGSSVVVFGCGGIGLNAIQGAAIAGARQIIAIDMSAEKLELARVFGATDVIDARDGVSVERVGVLTDGVGVDYVFDCVGLPSAVREGVEMVRPGHSVYLVGLPPVGVDYLVGGPELVLFGKSLSGLLMGSNNFKRDIPLLADLYLRGKLKLDELISERISLDEVGDAMARMEQPGSPVARSVVVY